MQQLMKFESLANELLLDVFEYLPSVHLLRAFYNLNLRFNHLLTTHLRSFTLDFRSVSQTDFKLICHDYLPNIIGHIHSLVLSNNDDTPQQIDLFFEHGLALRQFHDLQSLSIYDLCSNELMNKIMFGWQFLPNLTHLTLAGCYLKLNPMDSQRLIDNIWSLPKLVSCYLNIHFGEFNLLIPTVKSRSLKHLFIWGIEHNQNEIKALFSQTPCLQYLTILLNANDNDVQPSITSITKLRVCLSSIEENILVRFFKNMPNLYHLTVETCSIDVNNANGIFNGYQWENIIRNYLPKLQIFRFRMEFRLNQSINPNDLINFFQTAFWLKEHHWFIRCHWNSTSTATSIYLYTLPYVFHDFHFDCSMEFKSTSSDEKDYLFYNHVDELHYTNLSKERFILSPIRFLNINHLLIDLPIDENFWSIVPKLDRVTTLDISVNDHKNVQTQLQFLMNRILHLDSLSISSCRLSMLLDDLRNISIHRLDLGGCDEYFNDEQIRTLFNIQCEILFIKIKNRNALIDLIGHMSQLRTLNVQCEDDKFNETSEDEFIVWLKHHIPSTCTVSRDLVFHHDIRIWIR